MLTQHVFDRQLAGDAGVAEPNLELLAVEILRITEAGTGGEIEPDHAFDPEEVADFVTAELLGHCALTPEESIAALHGLGVAFANLNHEYLTHRLCQHLHRRIAISGDVLNAGAQSVGVPDPDHDAIIAHSQKDLPSNRVRQGHDFPRQRRRRTFLEFKGRSLTLLDEDCEVRRCDSSHVSQSD